ncbi:MAG: hypothetical protein V7713_00885 [Marinobacter sp.]|uniref:hypothetical protein n=1 Tax=Marinobacter sp. AC-23 TaxID=1879031 RepID=UPI0008DD7722|nr:hypothetical protein [Marinobacter sp. AC-23]OHY74044.1 hypothetical protein BCA33_18125 [Marinobacter sp. AC-23]
MTSPLAGAKEARSEIKKFHVSLNQENLVPEQCHRRNHRNYPMVSYVSQIAALFFSSNYEVIPVFISRTVTELERNADQPVTESYRKIVYEYLCQMTYFLANYTNVDSEKLKCHIPEEIRNAGSRKAPEMDYQT